MSTTIDAGGRLVLPKSVRDAMGLKPGMLLDVSFSDGVIEIEYAPIEADVEIGQGLPRIVPRGPVAELDDDTVRAAIESTRR